MIFLSGYNHNSLFLNNFLGNAINQLSLWSPWAIQVSC